MAEAFTLVGAQIYMTKPDVAVKALTTLSKGCRKEYLRDAGRRCGGAVLVARRSSLVGMVRYWQRQTAVEFC